MLSLGGTLVGYACTIGHVISGKLFLISRMGCEEYRSWFGSAVAVSGTGQGETPQSLVTPVFAGFAPIAENGIKVALTT